MKNNFSPSSKRTMARTVKLTNSAHPAIPIIPPLAAPAVRLTALPCDHRIDVPFLTRHWADTDGRHEIWERHGSSYVSWRRPDGSVVQLGWYEAWSMSFDDFDNYDTIQDAIRERIAEEARWESYRSNMLASTGIDVGEPEEE